MDREDEEEMNLRRKVLKEQLAAAEASQESAKEQIKAAKVIQDVGALFKELLLFELQKRGEFTGESGERELQWLW